MRNWHYSNYNVERKRYFDPVSLRVMALLGGGGILASMGGKKKQVDDPLAGIRQQLLDLSGQVPGMVTKQKELIKSIFADYGKTGQENIQENVHAERGLGRSSIESELTTDLMDKLAKGQAEEELAAEYKGLQTQSDILNRAGGLGVTPEVAEQPSFMEQILGMGSQMATQQMGMSGLEKLFSKESPLKKDYGLEVNEIEPTDWVSKLKETPNIYV